MEFVINEAVRSCCWRPVGECDCPSLVDNSDVTDNCGGKGGKPGPCPGTGGDGEQHGTDKASGDIGDRVLDLRTSKGDIDKEVDALGIEKLKKPILRKLLRYLRLDDTLTGDAAKSAVKKFMHDLRARDKVTANWEESKHPRAGDGKFGSGSGTPAKGDAKPEAKGDASPSGAAKVAKILVAVGKGSFATAKVSAKITAAAAKVLGSGIKLAYERYGNVGAIATFGVTAAVFAGPVVAAAVAGAAAGTGAAAGAAAAAPALALSTAVWGTAANEVRGLMKKFAGKIDDVQSGTTRNADDEDGLAKLCLVVVKRFATATGLPAPDIDLAGVKKILAKMED